MSTWLVNMKLNIVIYMDIIYFDQYFTHDDFWCPGCSYPQLEVSHGFDWRSLNYAFSYDVILSHSDIKLIPAT